jgi:hypothetical protein
MYSVALNREGLMRLSHIYDRGLIMYTKIDTVNDVKSPPLQTTTQIDTVNDVKSPPLQTTVRKTIRCFCTEMFSLSSVCIAWSRSRPRLRRVSREETSLLIGIRVSLPRLRERVARRQVY